MDICCLPKNQGGLGMKRADSVFKAKRIKFLIHVLKNEDATWSLTPMRNFKCLDVDMNVPCYALRADETPLLNKDQRGPRIL